jgi:protein-L-isoaspartate(D-aspartate) O-methyltransferase
LANNAPERNFNALIIGRCVALSFSDRRSRVETAATVNAAADVGFPVGNRGKAQIFAKPERLLWHQSADARQTAAIHAASGIDMAVASNPPEKMMFQLTLRRRGISDQAVLRTMEEVPREAFVAPADRGDAYRDSALGIACGQTISQPFVVAYMTEQLGVQRAHRVLEIGTGSGYQAAVLSRLCGDVVTIERYRTLADSARERLGKLGYTNVEVIVGDGFDVPDSAGVFDRIIVTAAMEQIPDNLLERLKPGGVLIAPVGPHHGVQTLVRIAMGEAGFERKELVDVRFVPALPGIAREL